MGFEIEFLRQLLIRNFFRKRSLNQTNKAHDQPDIKRLKISSPEYLNKPFVKKPSRFETKKRPVRKAFVSPFIRTLHSIAIDDNQNDLCYITEKSSPRSLDPFCMVSTCLLTYKESNPMN